MYDGVPGGRVVVRPSPGRCASVRAARALLDLSGHVLHAGRAERASVQRTGQRMTRRLPLPFRTDGQRIGTGPASARCRGQLWSSRRFEMKNLLLVSAIAACLPLMTLADTRMQSDLNGLDIDVVLTSPPIHALD